MRCEIQRITSQSIGIGGPYQLALATPYSNVMFISYDSRTSFEIDGAIEHGSLFPTAANSLNKRATTAALLSNCAGKITSLTPRAECWSTPARKASAFRAIWLVSSRGNPPELTEYRGTFVRGLPISDQAESLTRLLVSSPIWSRDNRSRATGGHG